MDTAAECAAESIGPVNLLYGLLLQSILASQCGISPKEMWPEDYGPTALEDGLEDYDFIIIGAGSAGSAVAGRLSEDPDVKVLLIEAGGTPPSESEVPNLALTLQKTPYDWQYFAEPSRTASLGLKNRQVYFPRGKMLGGSSGINFMLYIRGNKKNYDDWVEFGNPGWSWKDVQPYFKKSEDNRVPAIVAEKKCHRVGGTLTADYYTRGAPYLIEDVFRSAYGELGIEPVLDINCDKHLGFVRVEGTIRDGARCSAAKAFLSTQSIGDRENLHIIENAHVLKLEIDPDTKVVYGVQFVLNNKTLTAKAKKEVILSAGAINSPQLLMLSGIGPRKQLEKFDIPVICDSPGVGKNMQDHVFIPVAFQLLKSTAQPVTVADTLADISNYATNKSGTLSGLGIIDLITYINTKGHRKYPDIQLFNVIVNKQDPNLELLFNLFNIDDEAQAPIREANQGGVVNFVAITLLQPKSSGSVKLRSKDPFAKPKIYPNFFCDNDDLIPILKAVRLLQKFEKTQTIQAVEGEIVKINFRACRKFEPDSDDYWICYIRHLSISVYHPVGTCKMGPKSDRDAVVSSKLKVRCVHRLRVIDGSIMPKITSGNTNAPTIMIGEKGADLIKKEWNLSSAGDQ